MTIEGNSDPAIEQGGPSRERIGPFLLLGLDKNADAEQIEAHWAQRVIWARKDRSVVPLADINWARSVLNDPEARVRADVTSLNSDTLGGTVRELLERFNRSEPGAPSWRPMDRDERASDFVPATAVPSPADVRRSIVLPEVPDDLPGVAELLLRMIDAPVDPWDLELPPNQ